jgi:hypothetical protein
MAPAASILYGHSRAHEAACPRAALTDSRSTGLAGALRPGKIGRRYAHAHHPRIAGMSCAGMPGTLAERARSPRHSQCAECHHLCLCVALRALASSFR